jgi:hypothetical protein
MGAALFYRVSSPRSAQFVGWVGGGRLFRDSLICFFVTYTVTIGPTITAISAVIELTSAVSMFIFPTNEP